MGLRAREKGELPCAGATVCSSQGFALGFPQMGLVFRVRGAPPGTLVKDICPLSPLCDICINRTGSRPRVPRWDLGSRQRVVLPAGLHWVTSVLPGLGNSLGKVSPCFAMSSRLPQPLHPGLSCCLGPIPWAGAAGAQLHSCSCGENLRPRASGQPLWRARVAGKSP